MSSSESTQICGIGSSSSIRMFRTRFMLEDARISSELPDSEFSIGRLGSIVWEESLMGKGTTSG